MIAAPIVFLLLVAQTPATCADVSSCRAAALEAQARKDYEAFHDLAWLAYRKGHQDDGELMLLLARAQSLSGRPSDALVMLQRIASRGIATDAATSEDFTRVRALPRWKELFGPAEAASTAGPGTAAPGTPAPGTRAPGSAAPSTPSTSASAKPPASAEAPAGKPAGKPADKSSIPSPRRAPGSPLSFATLLTPSAFAYDAVSRRYLIADRTARRVAIVDENSGQVSTLAGTQAALGEIAGIAIDPQQGDLWVVSTTGGNTMLHRLQLISGRVLSTVPLSGVKAPIVALTFVRGGGLVAADSSGGLSRLSARGRLDQVTDLEYVPRTIASDGAGRLYVSPGGSKLARFTIDPRPGPREVLRLPDDAVVDGGIAIVGDRLDFLAQKDGRYEIRSISLRR